MAEYVCLEELRKHAICLYSYGGARYVPLAAIEKMKTANVPESCREDCAWAHGKRHQKCSCCKRNAHMKDNYERRAEK